MQTVVTTPITAMVSLSTSTATTITTATTAPTTRIVISNGRLIRQPMPITTTPATTATTTTITQATPTTQPASPAALCAQVRSAYAALVSTPAWQQFQRNSRNAKSQNQPQHDASTQPPAVTPTTVETQATATPTARNVSAPEPEVATFDEEPLNLSAQSGSKKNLPYITLPLPVPSRNRSVQLPPHLTQAILRHYVAQENDDILDLSLDRECLALQREAAALPSLVTGPTADDDPPPDRVLPPKKRALPLPIPSSTEQQPTSSKPVKRTPPPPPEGAPQSAASTSSAKPTFKRHLASTLSTYKKRKVRRSRYNRVADASTTESSASSSEDSQGPETLDTASEASIPEKRSSEYDAGKQLGRKSATSGESPSAASNKPQPESCTTIAILDRRPLSHFTPAALVRPPTVATKPPTRCTRASTRHSRSSSSAVITLPRLERQQQQEEEHEQQRAAHVQARQVQLEQRVLQAAVLIPALMSLDVPPPSPEPYLSS
ncbi:unnamed protein product [Sphagnum tenellum]